MAKFVVAAEFNTRPGDRDRVLEAGREEADAVRRLEPECHRFDVSADRDNPERGFFYEVFKDEAAFQAHRETPHFSAFFEAIGDLDVTWRSFRCDLVTD